jgi:hypothetical protein
VFSAIGIIKYDPVTDVFHFGDSVKITNKTSRGNTLTFRNRDAKIVGEGKYTLGDKMRFIDIKAAGQTTATYGVNQVLMDLALGINIMLPPKLLSIMIKDIEGNTFDAVGIDYKKDFFPNAIAEFITDEKKLEKVYQDLKEYERLFLPKDVANQFTFFFGNLPMVWDAEVQSFLSKGSTVGLGYINDKQINKQVKGHVEFRMTRQTDEMNLYFETSAGVYYYINYRMVEGDGVVSVFSTNPNFMETLKTMKNKELSFKMTDGNDFEIKETGAGAVTYFLNRAVRAN